MAAIERAKAEGTWDLPESSPVTDDQIAALVEALNGVEPASRTIPICRCRSDEPTQRSILTPRLRKVERGG